MSGAPEEREAAIERAAKAGQALAVHWGHQPWSDPWAQQVAKTVLDAALVGSEARERELRAECEKRGLPVDVAGLIRHCEGNAALTVAFDKIAAEKREAVLVEAGEKLLKAQELPGEVWARLCAEWEADPEALRRRAPVIALALAALDAALAARALVPVERPTDAQGRPLCFECGQPQSEHPGGIECPAGPVERPDEPCLSDEDWAQLGDLLRWILGKPGRYTMSEDAERDAERFLTFIANNPAARLPEQPDERRPLCPKCGDSNVGASTSPGPQMWRCYCCLHRWPTPVARLPELPDERMGVVDASGKFLSMGPLREDDCEEQDELSRARTTLAMIEALGRDGLKSAQELALMARSALRLPERPDEEAP